MENINWTNYFSFYSVAQMITKNFEDYPEHRLKFFSLLRAIATHCFPALICLSSQVFVSCLSVCHKSSQCLLVSICNSVVCLIFLVICVSNWSLLWIQSCGHFGIQNEILLKQGWTCCWRCWRSFRCGFSVWIPCS
jgi:hypothetical protein